MSNFTNSPPALIYTFVITVTGSIVSTLHFGQVMAASLSPTSRLQHVEESLNRLQTLIDTSCDYLEGYAPWARSEASGLRLRVEHARNHTSNLNLRQWFEASLSSDTMDDVRSVQSEVQTLIERSYYAKHPIRETLPPLPQSDHRCRLPSDPSQQPKEESFVV